jgi:hypothetical protein
VISEKKAKAQYFRMEIRKFPFLKKAQYLIFAAIYFENLQHKYNSTEKTIPPTALKKCKYEKKTFRSHRPIQGKRSRRSFTLTFF